VTVPVMSALGAADALADEAGADGDALGAGGDGVADVPRQADTTSGIGARAPSNLRTGWSCINDLRDSI